MTFEMIIDYGENKELFILEQNSGYQHNYTNVEPHEVSNYVKTCVDSFVAQMILGGKVNEI